MSTSGKFGERQSWRRAGNDKAGKRRTVKTVLTVLASLLVLAFVYIVLRRKPNPHLRTIVVSNTYGIDVVTPPMFADNALAKLTEQMSLVESDQVRRGEADRIRRDFQETDTVSRYLDDRDDTVMVVLRGYMMLDGEDRPALACTDLSLPPTGGPPQGLLPLTEILQPLTESEADEITGIRLVVIDTDPLAAHEGLDQWDEQVFAKLDSTLKALNGKFADRVWVLVTRGPLQNVGWDHVSRMPLSTQTLLDGLAGAADLDDDRNVLLGELCAFMTDRYERLPRGRQTETPQLMLFRGGTGEVDSRAVGRGELDLWVQYVPPKPKEESADQEPAEDTPSPPETDDTSETASHWQGHVRHVSLLQQPVDPDPTPDVEATEQDAAPQSPAASNQPEAGGATPGPAETENADENASGNTPAPSVAASETEARALDFWDLRDQLETVPPSISVDASSLSPAAAAPHLWRQLILKVLNWEIRNFDPRSSSKVPAQITSDLALLVDALQSDRAVGTINDDAIAEIYSMLSNHRDARKRGRVDQRLRLADQLQHAIAVARIRHWSWLEFRRQAIICNAQAPELDFGPVVDSAERILANGAGATVPDTGTMRRELSRLRSAIGVFDMNVATSVKRLLGEMAYAKEDPARTWESTRQAWAWLRSPLPTSAQRRAILQAIEKTPADPHDRDDENRDFNLSAIEFASPSASDSSRQLVLDVRNELARFSGTMDAASDQTDAWQKTLSDRSASFSDRLSAALRIDPRRSVAALDQPAIVHGVTAVPRVRNPTVQLLDPTGQTLGESSTIVFETINDARRLTLRVAPDRPQPTHLSIEFRVRSSASNDDATPIEVDWVGQPSFRPGQPLRVSINADDRRDFAIQLRPLKMGQGLESFQIELVIRNEDGAEEIDGVTGTRRVSFQLPQPNLIRLVASSAGGIGCSKESVSDQGELPGGLWLRTFNARRTPFQLELFNDSGKACRAQVWLIRLPSPIPDADTYWPDFASDRYASPDGGLLIDGRIQERFLRPSRILKGPAIVSIPANRQRVPVSFAAPGEGDAPAAAAESAAADVSHGMALVCRIVDEEGKPMLENDQIIVMVAKPWAPRDYVSVTSSFRDGDVEVDAELIRKIDGDDLPDEIPEIEKRPVLLSWIADDQWARFQRETRDPPDRRVIQMRQRGGDTAGYIRVPVEGLSRQTWVRLDVDGWPRSIRQLVEHRPGALGQDRSASEVDFESITMNYRTVGTETPEPTRFFAPREEVYFVGGNGDRFVVRLKADFADGVFNRTSAPEVRLEVEGRRAATYYSDRMITTSAVEITDSGRISLLTNVTDLESDLSQGQRSDARVPIVATLHAAGEEQDGKSITAVLDSMLPEINSILPQPRIALYAPAATKFSISVSDPGRDASGIASVDIGLDTKGDGKADTQRRSFPFDPPVINAPIPLSQTSFQFAVAGNYAVVVDATDAAGNRTTDLLRFELEKKPAPADSGASGANGKPMPAKTGWVHGTISTRANLLGTLSLVDPPATAREKDKDIIGQDRRFRFGPVPEGKYTLKFKGTKNGQSVAPMVWKDVEVDTTSNRSKPLSLDLSDAEEEE